MDDIDQYDNATIFLRQRSTQDEKMAEFGLTKETYCDFLDDHIFDLVRFINPDVFLDALRSERYLSECDCEEIGNQYRYVTRRERARKFCDTLKTKGFEACKKFLLLLEYEYPHVFQIVTDRIASNPPQGYVRHDEGRISQNIEELVRIGFKVQNLNVQKNNLSSQLEELQKMMEFTQKEKNDLEREVSSLRPYAILNVELQQKINDAEKEIRNLKDENRDFMKKIIQYRDDVDHGSSRIEQLLIDRDDLETKLKEANNHLERMNQSQVVLRERFEEERNRSQRLINNQIAHNRPPQRPANAVRQQARTLADYATRNEILQCDLDAEREKVRDVVATLEVTQTDLNNERQTSETLRKDKLRIQRELDQAQVFLKHAERKNDTYFKTIQELEKEKRKAEEEKILAQQKCWDISDQKQQLFVAKHNLEQKFYRLRQNYEAVRQSIRTRNSDTQEADDGGVSYRREVMNSPQIRPRVSPLLTRPPLNLEGEEASATSNADPFSTFLPYPSDPDPEDPSTDNQGPIKRRHKKGGNSLPGSFKSTDDEEKEKLRLSSSMMERGEKKIPPKPPLKPKPCDKKPQILHQRPKPDWVDYDDPRCWSGDEAINDEDIQPFNNGLHFRYERELSSSGSDDAQRDRDVFQLRQELLSTNSPYMSWFEGQDAPGESDSQKDGDDSVEKMNMKNLFVRSNVSWEDKTREDTVPINTGEFLYISDSAAKPNYFQVNKVEPISGYLMKRAASGLVPDFEQAKQFMRRPSQGGTTPDITASCRSPFVRRDAIRSRDCPYTVIAPLKATQKLPVLLNGHPTIVEAILDVLEKEADDWAMIVRKPVLIHQRQNWREMCDLLRHTIMPAHGINHQSDRDLHRYIIINVKLMGDDCLDNLRLIFGHNFEDIKCDKETAPSKWSLHSETLVLPSKIRDQGSLLSQLKEKVTKVQDNIFWMTISWKAINSLRATC